MERRDVKVWDTHVKRVKLSLVCDRFPHSFRLDQHFFPPSLSNEWRGNRHWMYLWLWGVSAGKLGKMLPPSHRSQGPRHHWHRRFRPIRVDLKKLEFIVVFSTLDCALEANLVEIGWLVDLISNFIGMRVSRREWNRPSSTRCNSAIF